MSGWSVGRRIGAGFALVALVVAALVAAVSFQLARNERIGTAVERALPEVERAQQVERALLFLAVTTRDAVRDPNPASLERFHGSDARLGQATRALDRAELDPQARREVNALLPLVERYTLESRRIVAIGKRDTYSELAELRFAVLQRVENIVDAERQASQAALGAMRENRRSAAAALGAAASVAALLLLLVGLLTVRSIRGPAQRLVEVAGALVRGNWEPALALRRESNGRNGGAAPGENGDEMARIAEAFAAAAEALKLREERLDAHRQIAAAAGASLEAGEVAAGGLRIVLGHLGAAVGAIYQAAPDATLLEPLASHAVAAPLAPVALGEGLAGQAARERRPLVLRDIPADAPFAVSLGYDRAAPRSAAALPILFGGELLGVLVVASLRELDGDALGFAAAAAAQLGVGMMNARAYAEVQRLLAEVRDKGERIQAQNEELQAQNEEIQAQNEELQSQGEEIQAQAEELEAQNDDLRRHREALLEKAGALESADARKNEFLGVLAHELRNPMSPISNCVELLKRAGPGEAAVGEVREILARQIQHLTRLIDDLLDVTRISRGKIILRRERLNVVELVHQCLNDQRAALEQAGLVLALDLPEVPIHVDGDYTRLCQVFSNLVSNAVKFSERGGRLAVRVTLDGVARQVSLHVLDNGSGIEPELLPRVFDAFSQGQGELARTKGGLGLGLALAKGLVELHGGTITAASEGPGRGAEFTIRLPLADARAEGVPAQADAQLFKLRPLGAVSPKRVLVIDDNADAAYSLAKLLSMEGCQVEIAYTAQTGLERAENFRPDAILCDIGLPGMDGYEFARRIRAAPGATCSLLVAVTGYATAADQDRALEAGFDAHLAKPPNVDRLLALLAKDSASTASQKDAS